MRAGIATRRTGFFTIAGFTAAALAALSAMFMLWAQDRSNHWVQHSLDVEVLLSEMTADVRTVESDHRGYLLNANHENRAELRQLSKRMPTLLDKLAFEVRDNSRQGPFVAQVRDAVEAKMAFAEQGVALVDSGHHTQAVAAFASGRGILLMQRALTAIQAMTAEEARLLVQRRQQTDTIVFGSGIALLLVVILMVLVAWIVLREARRRESELVTARDGAVAAQAAMREQMAGRDAAEAQVRQMQKMESIGQLTGGIAHDFNNMLAIVIGSLDLAKRRLQGDPDKLARCIDNAYEGAERAAALTARLLAFSRQQPLAPLTLDVNKLVSGMSDLLQRTMGEHYKVETVLAGGLWRTLIDPGQLENALLNLVVNARDAMPGGGRVTIETANAYLDDEYARDRGDVTSGQYVMISVSDDGEGMTPEVIERAFDPFFTTKPVGKGTGLGLSQIFGFMKQTGGHAAIYSEIGEGTTVKLYVPRAYGDISELRRVHISDNVTPVAANGETILVVEDEQRVRHFSVDALRELGYVVISAANGADALKALADQPRISMLFTDIVMPEMNGRQLADAALRICPDLKILFTTGYTRNAVVHNGVLDAGVAFLPKPFGVAQLAIKVREVLDGVGANRPL
jgi:signal transduction histidine kinase/ActR/RegA family two-component response regulator